MKKFLHDLFNIVDDHLDVIDRVDRAAQGEVDSRPVTVEVVRPSNETLGCRSGTYI